MSLKINGNIIPKKNFSKIYDGEINFETDQYGGNDSIIYILRYRDNLRDDFWNTFMGLTNTNHQEKLLNSMIPKFLYNIVGEKQSKIGIPKSKDSLPLIQIIGFGAYIPKSIEELVKKWGFREINTFFSDFEKSRLQKAFEDDPKNHIYFSGNFFTKGLMDYSVKDGRAKIKIIDSKSVHNGRTYIHSDNVKFKGEIMDTPRHLSREEDDQIRSKLNLTNKLRNKRFITFINESNEDGKREYFSENSIYLGKSGEEQTHKILFRTPFFKENINSEYEILKGKHLPSEVMEFKEYKINNRDWLTIENPKYLKLSIGEKEYLSKYRFCD